MVWIGFFASLAGIFLISKKNLALALISGAVILGIFTLPPDQVFEQVVRTLTDPSIVFLALAMGVIPIIGGTMKESGQIDSLVTNIRMSKRYLLPFSAALMGLLPMPGGALLSAPILEKGGEGVAGELKAAINNWFRHLLILIYPLSSALIASTKIVGLDVYVAVLYLLPGSFVALVLGYIFFLRKVDNHVRHSGPISLSELMIPMVVILSAPVLDFILKRLLSIGTAATLIGVLAALALSIGLSRARLNLGRIAVRMRPWNFALIIVGMFLYLHIFQQSDARNVIAGIPLPLLPLSVTAGFLLGLSTGRVELPASIVFPVYMASAEHVAPVVFALIYFGIYFGYVISPVHPCLVITCEYFRVPIREMIRGLAPPTAILFAAVLFASLVLAG